MIKRLPKILRIAFAIFALLLCGYSCFLLFLQYEIHRAERLLDELHGVKVGDSERSIKPLITTYSGYRWNSPLGAHADYSYVAVVNPWCFPLMATDKVCEKIHGIELAVKPRVRIAVGFRTWMATGEIAIKDGRVVAVQSEDIVEGQTIWLGAFWRLSDKPSEFEPNPNAPDQEPRQEHFASSGALDMASGSEHRGISGRRHRRQRFKRESREESISNVCAPSPPAKLPAT